MLLRDCPSSSSASIATKRLVHDVDQVIKFVGDLREVFVRSRLESFASRPELL
jgi:hypothetical protein